MNVILANPIARIFIYFMVLVVAFCLTTNINGSYGLVLVPEWYFTLFVTLFSVFTAVYLGQLDGNDSKISHHWLRFLIRGIILAIFPLLLAVYNTVDDIHFLEYFFYSCALFFPFFNQTYNKTKGHNAHYIGRIANFDKAIHWLNDLGLIKIFPFWLYFLQAILISLGLILIIK